MTARNPYDYDLATDTLRVSRHDLARLLIQFRVEVERDSRYRQWSHMVDYDRSFERLADAVDYGRAAFDNAPDDRMRCKRTAVYDWPDNAPYDGKAAEAVRVRAGSVNGETAPGTSHYVSFWDRCGLGYSGRALCGFSFAREEAKPFTGEPTCRECVREKRLATSHDQR